MFMIAMNRKFPQFVRNQEKRLWDRWPTSLLLNKKVGILGVGVIGEAIARKCKAFEMTVLGIDVIQRKVDAVDVFYGLDGLSKVASEADYFVSVVPSTPENEKMLNAGFFSRMKPTAFFISLGRGEVVDEDALLDALRERRIAGAALDTFCQEPLPADSPFWGMDNVIITPHVAGLTDDSMRAMGAQAVQAVGHLMRGEVPPNCINLQAVPAFRARVRRAGVEPAQRGI
jgi:phosphoglycerate dehydrogenase-like enzyme